MKFFNLMSCENFDKGILGGCSQGWLGFGLLIFLVLILRRQTDDGFLSGTGFNFISSIIGGFGAYLILITLFGDVRWAMLAGIAGVAVGGFLIGMIMPSGGGDY